MNSINVVEEATEDTPMRVSFANRDGFALASCDGEVFKSVFILFGEESEIEAIQLYKELKNSVVSTHGEIDIDKTMTYTASSYSIELLNSEHGVISTQVNSYWQGEGFDLSVGVDKVGKEWSVKVNLSNH